jgi:ABC-type multidrug transport system fused ATPase/permease subunit
VTRGIAGLDGIQGGPGGERTLAWLEDTRGARRYLDAESLVGRAAQADIHLDDGSVSRYHALLRPVDEAWVLADLGSSNGTYVNERALTGPRALRADDLLEFGRVRLRFRRPGDGQPPSSDGAALIVHATPVARIHHRPGSFASGQLAAVEARLTRFVESCRAVLGAVPSGPVEAVLRDTLPDPARPGATIEVGGYADPARNAIHEVYREDAPGRDLERSLLELLVGDAARAWPPTLAEAVLALLLDYPPGTETGDAGRDALAEARAAGTLPSPAALLAGRGAREDSEVAALADFLGFLRRERGAEPFRAFLAQLGAAGAEGAARAAFGQRLKALERRWQRGLRTTGPGGTRRFLRAMLPYLRPYWPRAAEVVFYLTCSVGFAIGLVKAQGYLIDRVLLSGDRRALALIMAGLVAAFVVVNLLSLRENYVRAWLSERVLRDLRLRMFERVQALHPGFFRRMDNGDIMARMSGDVGTLEFALTMGLAESVRMTLTLVLSAVTVLLTDWRLALLALICLPFFFLTGRFLGPPLGRASAARQERYGEMTSELHENLGAQTVVKAFGLEHRATASYAARLDAFFRSSLRLSLIGGLFNLASGSVSGALELAVLGIGGYLVTGGTLTAGELIVFLLLLSQIIAPLQVLTSTVQLFEQASGSLDRVDELLRAEPEIRDAPDARTLPRLTGAIGLEGVTFGYDDGPPVLRDLALTIPAGTTTALVGPSGCGKSTLLGLLPRFQDPTAGRVTFDGVDLRAASLASVRGQLGVVFQESVLFDTSIRENIRLGRPEASDAEVEAAARAAELHEAVLALPEGYDTAVGERGGRLSGGQRQRVAIARALLRDPAVLLLDEATSALDPATEAAIDGTLRRLSAGRTVVTVTHRLASVVHADRIVVLDRGRVVEEGRHEELLRRGGLYARLWQEQHGALAPAEVQEAAVEVPRLRRVPLFADLDPALLARVAQLLVIERQEPGATIVTAGDRGDRLYIVHRGEVEVLLPAPGGGSRSLATLREGDHFGEAALLRDTPRTATVRARSAATLFSLGRDDLGALLAADPRLRERLEAAMTARDQGRSAALATLAS